MRYSLISRFRGAVVGAVIGETLPIKNVKQEKELAFQTQASLNVMKFASKSLIAQGKLDLEDCLRIKPVNHILNPLNSNTSSNVNIDLNEQPLLTTIFATLPVALFFHENSLKLKQNISDVVQAYSDDLAIRDITLAVGYAIAKSLTENLKPATLIPQIVDFLGNTPTDTPQQLFKIHHLLEQGASLEQVNIELSKVSKAEQPHKNSPHQYTASQLVAVAFYCFLVTLEDFRLSILLAHSNTDFTTIGTITGALSGAYNSTAGIPIAWQVRCSEQKSTTLHSNMGTQMVKLADGLLAVWSGVYDIEQQTNGTNEIGNSTLSNQRLPLLETDSHWQVSASPRVIKCR
ncbi:ADP-ribosylglycohydrolase family protein [Calothrix sp. UHCC 0171]|uniref:ADP-ribosylglycohydrolase family protein n=1 Tax=Calothrix sp. UHCC 0171 TaxID=3110245 RepID=UPI002B22074F|nr:ADP-ribosylglycohydrolase family protein [Calothrix sp. UHCC 0171]MEA5571801.1 ADP-ribosylglycohydrolase family protein [Calothrix sp. UHCC 0171]